MDANDFHQGAIARLHLKHHIPYGLHGSFTNEVFLLNGNDPKHWHTNIPTYAQVKYQQVYPGVDMVYYGNQQQLEYDF